MLHPLAAWHKAKAARDVAPAAEALASRALELARACKDKLELSVLIRGLRALTAAAELPMPQVPFVNLRRIRARARTPPDPAPQPAARATAGSARTRASPGRRVQRFAVAGTGQAMVGLHSPQAARALAHPEGGPESSADPGKATGALRSRSAGPRTGPERGAVGRAEPGRPAGGRRAQQRAAGRRPTGEPGAFKVVPVI